MRQTTTATALTHPPKGQATMSTTAFIVLTAFALLALLAPAEASAAGPAGMEGPAKTCFDNKDNDGDGLIDLDDDDCAGKGDGDSPTPPDNIRARFIGDHNDGSPAAVTGDGVLCNDLSDDFDYVNPNDDGCMDTPVPPIDRSSLSTEGVWWLGIKFAEAKLDGDDDDKDGNTDEILVDRWAVFDFYEALVSPNDAYTGSLDPECPDLDGAYDNPDYGMDGGPAVNHKRNDTRCVDGSHVDHVVLGIRTERAVDLFGLPDGEILLEHFRVVVPGPVTQSGSRNWRPLYSFSYGAWEKTTDLDADPDGNEIIIRTKAPHEADLIEEGNGPVSRRIVGTYNFPVEIKLKRVPVPSSN